MRQICIRLSCILVAVGFVSVATAEEPIFTVQSSSTTRLLEAAQKLGLPDPIASAGLESKTTLDRLSDSIAVNQTSGGFIFLTPDRPHLVICLPLTNINGFMKALDAFSTTAPVSGPNGVYTIGKDSKFFAKQAGSFMLLSDESKFLADAANAMLSNPWTNIQDDIKIKADLHRLVPTGKSILVAEVLSMTTTKPTAGVYLNADSIKDHLRYGLQQYFAQSLFECRSFEIALNVAANDEVKIQISTQEDTNRLRNPSLFQHSQAPNAMLAMDFTSLLSDSNTQDTIKWITNWEKDLVGAVDNDSIQDRTDVASTKRIVKFFSELIQQSVANRKLDGYATIGKSDDQGYIAGAIAVSDSSKLAQQLSEALASAKQMGLSFTDLRAKGNSAADSQADYLIDLPKNMPILGVDVGDKAKLHVRIANQGVWIGIGNESEQLRQRVISDPDNGQSPITLNCDLDTEGSRESEPSNLLPFNFRQMKLNVHVTDTGRVYDIAFGKPSQQIPGKPSISAQAASN